MKWLFNQDATISSKNKQILQQQRIVQMLSKSPHPLTIDEIRKALRISTPTGIKLINDLLNKGIVRQEGKKATDNGRKPTLYTLGDVEVYSVSVEILFNKITVSLIDLNLQIRDYRENTDFVLENTEEALQEVISYVCGAMEEFHVNSGSLLGIGIGITGRINTETGESLSFFTWLQPSIQEYLEKTFQLPVLVNNDTRCLGLAEKKIGSAQDVRNTIIINLSQGLGTSLIIENTIVNGGNGFAGELGHMQFGDNDKMCICGKRGCLGNEVSGYALEGKFKEALGRGELSLLMDEKPPEKVRHTDILHAALHGDSLSIKLLQDMGHKLGRALGNIINLLNPELIIIGGNFASAESILGDALKSGMTNTALINPLKNCEIEFSKLGDLAGLKGAGSMVFSHFELI